MPHSNSRDEMRWDPLVSTMNYHASSCLSILHSILIEVCDSDDPSPRVVFLLFVSASNLVEGSHSSIDDGQGQNKSTL